VKLSRRAKRMERNHKKNKMASLNLVSLMDIFTILVFFLLVSSSNSYQLPTAKDLTLPISITDNPPQETIVIAVTPQEILVDGYKIGDVSLIEKSEDDSIALLKEHLLRLKGDTTDAMNKVTIMGDQHTSYMLISKILNSCQQANYTQIAFAALQNDLPAQ
jgi:biopolymer transport protein ExbD